MKKIFILMVLLVVAACGKKDNGKITLNLKGELPKSGKVRVEVYGYDKMLADHKATLIVIHRENLNEKKEVVVELPEDAPDTIDPPIKDREKASYYVTIKVTGEGENFTQDYERNGFIEVEEDITLDVYIKKQ